jgi:hypothetical protein
MQIQLLYIDPGSGSYLVQMIIAGILGALFYFKNMWRRIRAFFSGSKGDLGKNSESGGRYSEGSTRNSEGGTRDSEGPAGDKATFTVDSQGLTIDKKEPTPKDNH